jgi:hypothetical protein
MVMASSIIVPIPRADFDPTEVAVPWRVLTEAGFAVRDGNYISARWPGDVHRYSSELVSVLSSGRKPSGSSRAVLG